MNTGRAWHRVHQPMSESFQSTSAIGAVELSWRSIDVIISTETGTVTKSPTPSNAAPSRLNTKRVTIVREPRIPTVLEREADPQEADLYACETEQESDVLKRPREDPQALSREHQNFEHDPGAQHREQDAGEEAPASPVSGPRKVDRFADGDLIPPHRHEKSRLTVPLTSCALSQPDCCTADP